MSRQIKVKTENIIFTHAGNGYSVCDTSREKYGDYLMIAHINRNREVKYYSNVDNEAKRFIKEFANTSNEQINGTDILNPIQIEKVKDFDDVISAMQYLHDNPKATKTNMLELYKSDITKVGEQIVLVDDMGLLKEK